MQTTLRQFLKQFPTDESCLEHLFKTRFGQGHECPKCKKAAKWYRLSNERAYSCQWCGHHLHPTAGTLFQDTRTPLQSWFFAIFLFTTTRHGVSAKELQRQLGVTYKTAWRIGHEIRKHMDKVRGNEPLSGTVEIDEAMIGGVRTGKRGRAAEGKTLLLGMIERGGNVAVEVVPNAKRSTVGPVIERSVAKGSVIHTDAMPSYASLERSGYTHKVINHAGGDYAVGDRHVNTIEGYWSMLQRSIRGTHVWVSGKHLERYVSEFSYRHNWRKAPWVMLPELLSRFPASSQ